MRIRALVVWTTLMFASAGLAEAQETQAPGLFRITERLEEIEHADRGQVDKAIIAQAAAHVAKRKKELERDPNRGFVGVRVQLSNAKRLHTSLVKPTASKADKRRLWLAMRLDRYRPFHSWSHRVKTETVQATHIGWSTVRTIFVSSERVVMKRGPNGSKGVERLADQVALVINHYDPTQEPRLTTSPPIHVSLDELSRLGTDPDEAAKTELGALIRSVHGQTSTTSTTLSSISIHPVQGSRLGKTIAELPKALLDPERRLSVLPPDRTAALLEERRALATVTLTPAEIMALKQAKLTQANQALTSPGPVIEERSATDPRPGAKAALERVGGD